MSSKVKFKIVHATSREPGCDEQQLEVHNRQNKGWQSARFCDYPQEIVVELVETSTIKQLQILSHQSKISRRIELYVGTVGRNANSWRDADFKRLGYLSLDKNERSNFRARELKSVYIDTRAKFIKLSLQESHINAINLFNQVGIVALNVLGDTVKAGAPDDMAFDLEYDSRTAQEIREMEASKRRAVAEEDYDEAKRLKVAIQHLKQVGAQIQELEQQKKAAVEDEDYDLAKRLKLQVEALRLNKAPQPDHGPLHHGGDQLSRNPYQQGQAYSSSQSGPEPSRRPYPDAAPHRTPPHSSHHTPNRSQSQSHDLPSYSPHQMPDRQPQGAVANSPPQVQMQRMQHSPPGNLGAPPQEPMRHQPPEDINPDNLAIRPMAHGTDPTKVANPFGHAQPPASGGSSSDLPRPQPMTGAQRKDAGMLIEIFGEYTAQCVFSKVWNLREEALKKIGEWWQNSESKGAGDLLSAYQETLGTCVMKRVLKDRVTTVFLSGVNLLADILDKHVGQIPRQDVMSKVQDLVTGLVAKLGTTNPRVLEAVGNLLVNLAHHDKVGPRCVCVALLKPPTNRTKPLELRSRGQIMLELLPQFKLSQNAGLTLHALMRNMVVPQLEHKDDDVRKIGIQLAAICYQLAGRKVVPYINKLKDAMRETLNIAFEDATGEQSVLERDPTSLKEQKRPSKTMSGPKSNAPKPKRRRGTRGARQRQSRSTAKKSPVKSPIKSPIKRRDSNAGTAQHGGEEDGQFQEELGFCQFCALKDDKFFEEENLDLHYWQDCPMLTSCLICEQVIEISTLYDHLCDECEMVTDATLDQHYADLVKHFEQSPPPAPEDGNRCPLCFTDTQAGEEGWQHHLLTGGGCPKNSRPIPAGLKNR